MNPITLPTSPETRAALEKAGWQVQPINAGYVVLLKGKSTVGLWADGNHTISATAPEWNEAAAILGIGAPPGYVLVAEGDLEVIRNLLEEAGSKRQYDPSWIRPRILSAMEALDRITQAKFIIEAFSTPAADQAPALQAERGPVVPGTDPDPPRPSEEGGSSPSPLAAADDATAAMMSAVLDRERGFHQVNPINQRKAATEPREEETP